MTKMKDEWLIYHSPSLLRMVQMPASSYDSWAKDVGEMTRQEYPVIARGLTAQQATAMVRLSKENEDGNEI